MTGQNISFQGQSCVCVLVSSRSDTDLSNVSSTEEAYFADFSQLQIFMTNGAQATFSVA